MQILLGVVLSYIYIGIILLASKFFEKHSKEASRKFIHIMVTNTWILIMIFLKSTFWAAFVPFTFIIINTLSYKFKIIPSMERDDTESGEAGKGEFGTIYYAISFFLLVLIAFWGFKNPYLGLASVFIMGYADGLAGIVGQAVKSKEYRVFGSKKTVVGSIVMFLITFIITAGYLIYFQNSMWFVKTLVISFIITIIEGISVKGTDNFTVPILSCFLIHFISLI